MTRIAHLTALAAVALALVLAWRAYTVPPLDREIERWAWRMASPHRTAMECWVPWPGSAWYAPQPVRIGDTLWMCAQQSFVTTDTAHTGLTGNKIMSGEMARTK